MRKYWQYLLVYTRQCRIQVSCQTDWPPWLHFCSEREYRPCPTPSKCSPTSLSLTWGLPLTAYWGGSRWVAPPNQCCCVGPPVRVTWSLALSRPRCEIGAIKTCLPRLAHWSLPPLWILEWMWTWYEVSCTSHLPPSKHTSLRIARYTNRRLCLFCLVLTKFWACIQWPYQTLVKNKKSRYRYRTDRTVSKTSP